MLYYAPGARKKYTMYVMNDELFGKMDYAQTLGVAAKSLELLGPQEVLYFCGLSVFPDFERYPFHPEFAAILDRMREEHYPEYESQAYELGKRLVEKPVS